MVVQDTHGKVFFTMDHKMVIRKFVEVILSHYWTEDKRVSGLTVNLDAPDPFPDLRFSTSHVVANSMKVDGCIVHLYV